MLFHGKSSLQTHSRIHPDSHQWRSVNGWVGPLSHYSSDDLDQRRVYESAVSVCWKLVVSVFLFRSPNIAKATMMMEAGSSRRNNPPPPLPAQNRETTKNTSNRANIILRRRSDSIARAADPAKREAQAKSTTRCQVA